eukprot:Gregarina_sp_Poly_1__11311@NODE_946_length_5591_cov_81_272991_g670_i0_p7_GENE_NODE_946_length_5591_cov_81_272991_g670_i0NODE_946_length_5591_cov_81_272991_g670_i0_p7_ORF_typecomplete_len111_score22_08_NODE_946_length_5591_cov_81_272991_g670_i041634495
MGVLAGALALAMFFIQYFMGVVNMDTFVMDALELNQDPFPVSFMKLEGVYLWRTHWLLLGVAVSLMAVNALVWFVPSNGTLGQTHKSESEETSGLLTAPSPPNAPPSANP